MRARATCPAFGHAVVGCLRPLRGVIATLFFAALSGCAALTFPVGGVPAQRVPETLLGQAVEDNELIDLALLRQEPPDTYIIEGGDILGVWIEGILGEVGQAPPVHYPDRADLPPSLGVPIPVRDNGTLPLPLIKPVPVAGLSLPEAEEQIRKAYTVDTDILKTGEERIIVTVNRPREYHILVIRQDGGGPVATAGRGPIGGLSISTSKRGTGHAIDLPAYKNDVLNALAATGGMPGLDAKNEIVVQRGGGKRGPKKEIRIPLRVRPGQQPDINPQDIVLETGDIVSIESRDVEVFYTGGLLPTGEFPLPRDYDLDVLEAIALVNGPLVSGGTQTAQLTLSNESVGGGIGGPSPSLVVVLRRTPDGGQVPIRVDLNRAIRDPRERILIQPGDVVLMQQTPGEAVARYLTSGVLRFFANFELFESEDATGTATVSLP